MPYDSRGLNQQQRWLKRSFDLTIALLGLILSSWIILLAWLAATLTTGYNGFFTQKRIGRYGQPFLRYQTSHHESLARVWHYRDH